MNTFATLEDFEQHKRIGYYTIRGDGRKPEVEDFFERMELIDEVSIYVNRLLHWLDRIGRIGYSIDNDFRHEGICVALPKEKSDLRLYCHILSDGVIVLFNGGIKTRRYPDECPNVRSHFRNAKIWAQRLDEENISIERTVIINRAEVLIKY